MSKSSQDDSTPVAPKRRGRPPKKKPSEGESYSAPTQESSSSSYSESQQENYSSSPEPQQREVFNPSSNDSNQDTSFGSASQGGAQEGGQPQQQPASQGGGFGQGHQQGHHQGHGGGWQERKFWKQGKNRKGRFGKWQGNQGGPQQGHHNPNPQHSQHPAQPAPAPQQPIFGDLPRPERFTDLAALDQLALDISSGSAEALQLEKIYAFNLADLSAFARTQNIVIEGAPNRRQLLNQLLAQAAAQKQVIFDTGYVDINERGAFIVHEDVNYRLYPDDPYLPESLINRYGIKRGHQIKVQVQSPQNEERCPSVVKVIEVMGLAPEKILNITPFEELVPYYPLKRVLLEAPEVQKDVSMRAVDILTPIGFGQRGLIVAPPRTGKTVLLQNIANSISENSPEVKLILLLIDERPEEVTDFKRHTKGEVVSSTFDESPESHVHCAEMVGEKARRIVEHGGHVVVLLDSITRLARAYNALAANNGKIMSGGLEATALQKPKRFFGAARNIEGAGSLTIIATALIDTGSRMDEVIFEEFKGTGNMELHLDRGLVERRIFPSINIDRSGTRKEELIYHPEELQRIYGLRRAMQGLGPVESMEMLITRLKKTKSNAEFLMTLAR